jgi:hypothetical protein
MPGPELNIIGVYRPQISAETWNEQLQVTDDEAYTKKHFDKLVLIEATVNGLDKPLTWASLDRCRLSSPMIQSGCKWDTTRVCSQQTVRPSSTAR